MRQTMNPIQAKYKQTTDPPDTNTNTSGSQIQRWEWYKHINTNTCIAVTRNTKSHYQLTSSIHPSIHSPSRSMQAAIAAMAHVLLVAAPPSSSHTLLATLPNPSSVTRSSSSSSHSPSLHSAFHGVSLKFPSRLNLSLAAVASKKPLTVVAAAKKAVAVLKGTSNVEGVVTLTQEDGGLFSFNLSPLPSPLLSWVFVLASLVENSRRQFWYLSLV